MPTLATTHPAAIAELKAALIADIKKIWPATELLDPKTGYLKHSNDDGSKYQFWNVKKSGSKYSYQIDYLKDDFFIKFTLTSHEFFTKTKY